MPDAQKWSPASQLKHVCLNYQKRCKRQLRPTSSRDAVVMQRVFKGLQSKQKTWPDRNCLNRRARQLWDYVCRLIKNLGNQKKARAHCCEPKATANTRNTGVTVPFRFLFPLFRSIAAFIPLRGCGAKAKVQPEWVASSSQDPYWWQRLLHRCQLHIRSNFGVQYLAQGHFDMQLSWHELQHWGHVIGNHNGWFWGDLMRF